MTTTIFIIAFIVILLFLGLLFIALNLYRKVSIYEQWIDDIRDRLQSGYVKLKQVDIHGAFEADDEVGYFFKLLKSTIDYINQLTGYDNN